MAHGLFAISREAIVDMLSGGYSSDTPPSPQEVQQHVYAYLDNNLFSHLKPEAEWIVTELLRRIDVMIGSTSVLMSDEGHLPWLMDADPVNWRLWRRLKHYLQYSVRLPPVVLAELESSTDRTLEQLENPYRDGPWDRRGMVVGHVQSGKTTHYTSLAAKALDAGYRAIIIIAGVHNNLRSQTQFRVDQYVLGRDTRRQVAAFGSSPPIKFGSALHAERNGLEGPDDAPQYSVLNCTSSDENGDFKEPLAQQVWFGLSEHNRLVMVVKKNGAILSKMTHWLNKLLASGHGQIDHPTIIIDDEADQASVNTRGQDNPTKINALIRRLVKSLRRVGYVGYTATPYANIFIDADFEHEDPTLGRDLFPRDFIVNLKAPSDYVGPEVVFGHDGDESVGLPERPALPMYVAVSDTGTWLPARHKGTHTPGPLPQSLLEAIRLFVCVCAARRSRGDELCHNSMLIHATRFTKVQSKVVAQVRESIQEIGNIVAFGGPGDRSRMLTLLMDAWEKRVVAVHDEFVSILGERCPLLPEWESVQRQLTPALEAIKVFEINGTSDDSLAYASHQSGLHVIAVGGDKLSRGLTLENLSVSYFLRASNAYDTLMQMGRWFGYRHGYIDLCRIYTTAELYSAFREISLATEELRSDLDRMAAVNRKPIDFGLRVRKPSPRLMITARNKIKNGQPVLLRFAGELCQGLEVPKTGVAAEANRIALTGLISALPPPARPTRASVKSHFVWTNVEASSVLEFLGAFTAYRDTAFIPTVDQKCDAIWRYICERLECGELKTWTVCLVSHNRANGVAVDIAGFDVKLVHRKKLDSTAERFRIGTLAGRAEEAVDLTDNEFVKAVTATNEHPDGKRNTDRIPGREQVREVRPKERGLLLLYPLLSNPPKKIADDPADPEEQRANYLVSAAVSFPDSSGAEPVAYMANPVWMQEYRYLMEDDDVDS
jgi:hypothetical protein